MGDGKLPDLVVIGAGLPRTGTLSTRAVLELLLGGPCYHGSVPAVEREDHRAAWQQAYSSMDIQPVLDSGVLDGFKAGLDHPFMCWYKELLLVQPDAKVLLTVRDPKRWYASMQGFNTIVHSLVNTFPYSEFLYLVGLGTGVEYMRGAMAETCGISGKFQEAVSGGEEKAVEFFKSHIDEVKSVVPKDQLLVFDVREGWEPLCSFLDLPMPDIPFPNVNDRRQILFIYNIIRLFAWSTLLTLPMLLISACVQFQQMAGVIGIVGLSCGILYLVGQVIRTVLRKHTKQKTKEL